MEVNMGTVWAERRPGEIAAATPPDLDGSVEVIMDPHLSPDWVRLPPGTPYGLGGVQARVESSVWLPIGVDPSWSPGDGQGTPWTDTRTRWHLVRPEGWSKPYPMALAEVVGHGWVLLDLGEDRTSAMQEYANELGGHHG